MKVIDLLNKIAKGEEVPKYIHIMQFKNDFIFNGDDYKSVDRLSQSIYTALNNDALNYEVEIIEYKEEKKIPEKLPKSVTDNACSSKDMRLIAITLNQVIDYLKSKGE